MERERQFKVLLREMQSRDPQRAEDGFAAIEERATEFEDLLLDEYRRATAEGSGDFPSTPRRRCRVWLLELLSGTGSSSLIATFVEGLDDEEVRPWAIRGLKVIDNKDARRILWEAGLKDPS